MHIFEGGPLVRNGGFAVAALLATTLVAMTVPITLAAPAPPGGTHIGYVDTFPVPGEAVPQNYIVVAGPGDAWRVAGNTLQAVRVAGTQIALLDPNLPIENIGNQLLGLCINPEQTINSFFYSGFTVNEAPIVEVNLGTLLNNLLKIRLNVPADTLQVIDTVNGVVQTINLGALGQQIQFNQDTCINLLLLADANQLLVIVGNTLDSLGHVVGGVSQVVQLNSNAPLPEGTFSLIQPVSNTGRVVFKQIHLQTTPDVPLDLQAFAGPGDGQITLTWDLPVADGGAYVTAFNVYRGETPDFADMELVGVVQGGFEQSFTDQVYTGLSLDATKYYYRVTAQNMVGEGPLAMSACGIPYPMGLLLLENSGFGCGTHGLVEAPTLEPFLP